MLGRMRLVLDGNDGFLAKGLDRGKVDGITPRGVAKAASEGAAMPRKGTKCAGPMTTARLIQLQRRRLPKAAAATRPEYAYPACGAMIPQFPERSCTAAEQRRASTVRLSVCVDCG